MDYITLSAAGFVVVFIVLGVFRGFWKAFGAISSFIVGYLAALYFAPPASDWLIKQFDLAGINETIVWGACASFIFIVAGYCTRLLVSGIGKLLPIGSSIINRSGGAILSGGYGAAMVVFLVWGVTLLIDAKSDPSGMSKPFYVDENGVPPKVVTWSRDIVSKVVQWNAREGGASETVADISGALAKDPAKVLTGVQTALNTPEFKDVVASEKLQEFVRSKDVESVKNSPEFTELMKQPAVKQLQEMILPSEGEVNEDEVAEHFVELWHNIDLVKNDPEIMTLVNDPEIQSFLRSGGGQVTASLLQKGQSLLSLISTKTDIPLADVKLPKVYSWYDDEGKLNVTEYDQIPDNKRSGAQRMNP